MTLSPKQQQIAAYGGSPYRWTLASGPVGSGKTHAGLIGFTLETSQWGSSDFGVLTKGWPQLHAVLRGGLAQILGYPISLNSDGYFELPSLVGPPNRIWCFVAKDKGAEPRLRSFNLSGMLLDEMTTLPFNMIAAANARCRVGNAKLLGLTNPDGPRHPVKLNYFDNCEQVNGQAIYTEIRDNPALSQAYIDSLYANYSGHMLERMVYGRWAAASGLVYPHLIEATYQPPPWHGAAWTNLETGEAKPPNVELPVAFDVAIDVGESSVTHALLAARTTHGNTWIIGECRHEHVSEGVLKERELVAKIRRAFSGYDITSWIVDPAAKRFRKELLNQMPGARVGKGVNDLKEGIEEVNLWVAADALHIWGDKCPHLIAEIGALVWDDQQAAAGKDVPIDTPDHGTDALRYLVATRAVHESGGYDAWLATRRRQRER